jgi:hypothetical protein
MRAMARFNYIRCTPTQQLPPSGLNSEIPCEDKIPFSG